MIIERFLSGIITRRSQLYPPFRAIGLNIVQFHDVLTDGLNLECSDVYTLQRRPGYSSWNNVALQSGEIINQFYSFRDLDGNVYPLFDSNQRLALIGTGSNTTLYTKNTTAQGFVSPVGNILYYCDGTDAKKYDTVNDLVTSWGITAPTVTPSIALFPGATTALCWLASTAYTVNTCIQDTNGNIEIAISPGTSGTIEPIWPTVAGSSVSDGGPLKWNNIGPPQTWYPQFSYSQPAVVIDTNGNLQWLYEVTGQPQPWNASTSYTVGEIVSFGQQYWASTTTVPAHPPGGSYTAVGNTSGSTTTTNTSIYWNLVSAPTVSGTVAPTWGTTPGSLTTDNGYTWMNVGPGTQLVTAGYSWRYAFRTVYGHLSTASTASVNTGPVLGPGVANIVGFEISNLGVLTITTAYNNFSADQIVQISGLTVGTYLNDIPLTVHAVTAPTALSITSVSITSGVATITSAQNLTAGTTVTFSNLVNATQLNGLTGVVLSSGLSGSQFEVDVSLGNYGSAADTGTALVANTFTVLYSAHAAVGFTVDSGNAQIAFAQISGQGSAFTQTNYTATLSNVNVSAQIITIECVNRLSAGCTVSFSGLSNATFLNGQQVQITAAYPTYFTAVPPQSYLNIGAPNYNSSDSGTVTLNAIEIYRIADGGSIWYFDSALVNPGGGSTWTYDDFVPDAQLNNFVPAPINHQNDPPPGQAGSLITGGGTILAWWMGRNWMAVGSSLYFDGGPDVLNGVPQECWPPANTFEFPGQITNLWSTTEGLIVITADQWHVILGGPQTLSFYPDKIMDRFGISQPNAMDIDGNEASMLTTQGQFFSCTVANKEAVGQKVADLIATNFSPSSSYVTIHRNGLDDGIILSNNNQYQLRYGINVQNFSPLYTPAMTSGAIRSVETSPGIYTMFLAPTTAAGKIYYRNINAWSDAGTAYEAFATIGSITLSEPLNPLVPLCHIAGYFTNVSQPLPTISVLFNEISATNGAAFVVLPEAVPEPPIGAAESLTLQQARWPVRMNQNGTSMMVHHVQVKVDFGNTSTVRDEILAIALKFDEEN